MALDYLQELKKFSAGGGTDIGDFLKQHTQATQTTPGPSVPKPVSEITPPPTPPNPVAPPPISGQNVVRQAIAPAPPPVTGAVASLPAPRSRSLYPPAGDQARILGEARPPTPITVAPARPEQPRSTFSPRFPVLGTAPAQPSATSSTTAAPAEDPYRFRLPSEKKSGRDFLTGAKISQADDVPPGAAPYSSGPLANPKPTPRPNSMAATTVLPRQRNQRALVNPTVPRIFAGAV